MRDLKTTWRAVLTAGVVGAAMCAPASAQEATEVLGLKDRTIGFALASTRWGIHETADGKKVHNTAVTPRDYLADAAFLVALEGDDRALLAKTHAALCDPVWPLALGRKSYLPSESIWIDGGLQDAPLRDLLVQWPWQATRRRWEALPGQLLMSLESPDGSGALRMDRLLSSFAERRFGARFVRSEWIPFPGEASHAAA